MSRCPAGAPLLRRRIEHVDTDASGVVHFTRHLSLLESAVLELLERSGAGLGVLAGLGADLAIAAVEARYLSSCRYRDLVTAEAAITRVTAARVHAGASLLREEPGGGRTELSRGAFMFAVTGPQGEGPVPLPPPVRDALKGIVVDPG